MTTPDGGIAIREARTADASALAELAGQLGYPAGFAEVAQRLAEILARRDTVVFVADRGGRVVGWIQATDVPVLESPRRAEIRGLAVDEPARGSGIGSALLARAERWAEARGLAAIRIASNVVRMRAHGLFLRSGFTPGKEQRVFEKRLGRGDA